MIDLILNTDWWQIVGACVATYLLGIMPAAVLVSAFALDEFEDEPVAMILCWPIMLGGIIGALINGLVQLGIRLLQSVL